MIEGARFHNMLGGAGMGGGRGKLENESNGFYDMSCYHKVEESSHMSVDSADNMNSMNFVGGSVAMSVDNSSAASNESRTVMLNHPGLRDALTPNYLVCNSVIYPNWAAASVLKEDALARVLMRWLLPVP